VEGTVWALRRSMLLLAEVAGATVDPGLIDQYPRPWRPLEITLRVEKTNEFLGTDLSAEAMAGHLSALELGVRREGSESLVVTPPACRVDLLREVDMMEEVARMVGYARIPVTLPAVRPEEEADPPEVSLGDRIREMMAGLGFSEVITFSFMSEEAIEALGAPEGSALRDTVKLLKPLTQDQAVMRTTLLPGLLQAACSNMARGERNLKLFEWGRVFLPEEGFELPGERLFLAGVIVGAWTPGTLHQPLRAADFYDAKGVVESLLEHLHVKGVDFERVTPPPGYRGERTAGFFVKGSPLGTVGELDPPAAERFDIGPEKAFVFELDIPALRKAMPRVTAFEGYAPFPAVVRDLSMVLDSDVESESVREIIAGEKLVESVELFDLYRGDRVGPAEKALTFRVCFRSPDRTLKGKEVNDLHDKIVRRIQKRVGGRLRDG
jgi:phenylalanyl-tRNA synthetase beta chain